jgi:hypothetical protein
MGHYDINKILACRPVALFKTYTGRIKNNKPWFTDDQPAEELQATFQA